MNGNMNLGKRVTALEKGGGGGDIAKNVNYAFMFFRENKLEAVTSEETVPIPFVDIESSGLTVEGNKVKLQEGHKYFITASAQNTTSNYYINIRNKDGIYAINGSDGTYQPATQSCIYVAGKDDFIYLSVTDGSGSGAGTIRRNATFTVIEL